MYPDQEIRNELAAIGSTLADMPRHVPYRAPEGYFSRLEAGIRTALQYEKDPELSFPTAMPYQVPEGYFQALPSRLAGLVKESDPAADIPAAATPFQVPPGYFENLPGRVMDSIRAEERQALPTTKIIPLRRFSVRKTLRLAAAAVLLAVAGIGVYRLAMPQQDHIRQQLAGLSKDAISDYLLVHVDELETEELVSFSGSGFGDATRLPASREDIIQYLDETGWDTGLN